MVIRGGRDLVFIASGFGSQQVFIGRIAWVFDYGTGKLTFSELLDRTRVPHYALNEISAETRSRSGAEAAVAACYQAGPLIPGSVRPKDLHDAERAVALRPA
jgi:hypothetical protein